MKKLPKELVGKECERCGEQAFTAVQDTVRELTPGSLRVRFKPDGEIHWFCLRHERESAHRDVRV